MTIEPSGFPVRDDLWLDGDVVVRVHPEATVASISWVHCFLDRLAATGFVAPKPVPHLDGRSVALAHGVVRSAVSFVPGEIVGWKSEPDLHALGAHLAAFHDASGSTGLPDQRPGSFPVESLPDMADELRSIGHGERWTCVVHGDMTAHNVLASGSPPRPCGVIDFANAFVEVPLFDIGCALWRTGRPSQAAREFDPERVARYVNGYASVRSLDADDRRACVVYLFARGAQIIAKQAARGVVDDGPRRRLDWLRRNRERLLAELR